MGKERNGATKMSDPINHPDYYGGEENIYETIKILEAKLTPEEFVGFNKGNAIKYLDRAKGKAKGKKELEDYKKAAWYLNNLITFKEKKNEKSRT